MYDHTGLQLGDRAECLLLLATQPVGRIVFTQSALPAVEPVTFVLDGEDIVIRTRPGSTLALATRDSVVAFEADDIDVDQYRGWSVTVVGRSSRVDDPAEVRRLTGLPLHTWAPGPHDEFVRIGTELVTGQRLVAGAGTPAHHVAG